MVCYSARTKRLYIKDEIQSSYNIPNGVTRIANRAFTNCINLTNVTIPDSITSIGHDAFYECKGLTNITIPENVLTIGESAFCGCSGLSNIDIPNSMTTISENIFKGCIALKQVNIPKSIAEIDLAAFEECNNLKDVYYDGSKDEWKKIIIQHHNDSLYNINIHCLDGIIIIPPPPYLNVTSIGSYKDSSIIVEPSNISYEQGVIVLAIYEKNGMFRSILTKPIAERVTFENLDKSDFNIKVMLWDNLENMKPLAESVEMSL